MRHIFIQFYLFAFKTFYFETNLYKSWKYYREFLDTLLLASPYVTIFYNQRRFILGTSVLDVMLSTKIQTLFRFYQFSH